MKGKLYFLWGMMFLTNLIVTSTRADLTHRYAFDDPNDYIGGADGTLVNLTDNALFTNGRLVLGNTGAQGSNANDGDYLDLPNGMISTNGNQATFEFWLTWDGPSASNWQEFMSFGTSNAGEDSSGGAGSSTYIMFTPRSGDAATGNRLRFGYRYGSTSTERFLDHSSAMAMGEEWHVVGTWDGAAGIVTMYVNGEEITSGEIHFNLSDMTDNNNWLGRSQWPDPMFVGNYNEFRIYNHVLTAKEIAGNYAAGPDAMPAIVVFPTDEATDIGLAPTLEWEPASIIPGTLTEYDIYFGEDPDAVALATTADTSGIYQGTVNAVINTHGLDSLETDKTYYWRIDQIAVKDPNIFVVPGPVWSFETIKTLPILTGPEDIRVCPDAPATFASGIDSQTAVVSCEWYKVVGELEDTSDDILLVDGEKYVTFCGETETTLTINDVTADDVGQYYCLVANAAGPEASMAASLGLKLLMAHYEFETAADPNVPDSSGESNVGTAAGDPTLVAGLVGNGAFEFDGDDNVAIPRMIQDDFTISVWVKTTQTISNTGSGWWTGAGLVNGEMPGVVNDFGLQLLGSKASIAVEGTQLASDTNINDDVWHHVAFTRTRSTGQMKLYVDGQMEVEGTGNTASLTVPTGLQIGKQQTGSGYFIGRIDDVRVYDYALNELEIADLVYTVTGEPICTGEVLYDFNNDCEVSLEDFAIFASEWLNCKWYPQCFE
ncbi:MAG: hypothetical protein JXA82_09135 [Sedimentisphaerales bacterium]|nr:hypothetical protein [Sedimentisphaerales bacterium]